MSIMRASIGAAVVISLGLASCEKPQPTTAPPTPAKPPAAAVNPPTSPPIAPPAASETVLLGTLKSGFMGIGGEHTGWVIQPADDKERPQETDVSGVMDTAKPLDGKKVRATGTMVEKKYVERGLVKIFKVTKIEAAP